MPEILYLRTDDSIRLKMTGMTNHELRELMVGLWSTLDDDDKWDFVKELQHYFEQPQGLSELAKTIKVAVNFERSVNPGASS